MKHILTTGLCLIAALALVLFGLGWGAQQGWEKEYAQLTQSYQLMRAQQAACAANLERVALRHMDPENEKIKALRDDPAKGAQALGEYLLTLPTVQASPRDMSYVDSLVREMGQLSQSGAAKDYGKAASDYDRRLQSTFSGAIARGMKIPFSDSLTGSAAPQPRYPEQNEAISDMANVLSGDTLEALKDFKKELSRKAKIEFYLATVHFLDGQEISTYAQALAEKWQLDENALLILMAVGEDDYYAWAGSQVEKKLPSASRQILLSQQMQSHCLLQQYDQAFNAYIPALADSVNKAYGTTLTLTGAMAPMATAAPQKGLDWSKLFVYDADEADEETEDKLRLIIRGEEKGSGVSLGKTLALAFVLWLIFGNKKGRRGCSGCGCSPLGWILAALGLQKFFDRD